MNIIVRVGVISNDCKRKAFLTLASFKMPMQAGCLTRLDAQGKVETSYGYAVTDGSFSRFSCSSCSYASQTLLLYRVGPYSVG